MITLYLLKGCKHCSKVLKYLSTHDKFPLLLLILNKTEALKLKNQDSRLNTFPILFLGVPNENGLPNVNTKSISGSDNIIRYLINNTTSTKDYLNKDTKDSQELNSDKKKLSQSTTKYGKNKQLNGSNIDINLYNDNEGNIKNIRKYRPNCFGKSDFNCHIMDRPFGPMDNQYMLQNFQPNCAIPVRNDLLNKKTNFGITTPGTANWKSERKAWSRNEIPKVNCPQNNNGLSLNYPLNFKNSDSINSCNSKDNKNVSSKLKFNLEPKSKFGNKFVPALDNSNAPFLTYAAGGTTDSGMTGDPYFFTKQQNPIRLQSTGYISGDNIKKYATYNKNSMPLLYNGLDSKWSLNDQGITKFGSKIKYLPPNVPQNKNNPYTMVGLITDTDQGNFAVGQYFKRDMFPYNGNAYGKSSNKKSLNKKIEKKQDKIKKSFTTPLGIQISL